MTTNVGEMTIPVIFRKSGKCENIRGLYKHPASGRLYVRFSFHGVDRQVTIFPKNETFSELERCATAALSALKKRVKAEFNATPKAEQKSRLSPVEYGQKKMLEEVDRVWRARNVTKDYLVNLKRHLKGFALTDATRLSERAVIDDHNVQLLTERLDKAETSSVRARIYEGVNTVFTALINAGAHTGRNPALAVGQPKHLRKRRDEMLDFETAARVIMALRNSDFSELKKLELEAFFRLCMETGQRPRDVFSFRLDGLKDGTHYRFSSHKTTKEQRVMHLLSPQVIALLGRIVVLRGGLVSKSHNDATSIKGERQEAFWTRSSEMMEVDLNTLIRSVRREGSTVTLYCARHFFISEIFRRTESELWAEAFTHEARSVNARHYLHFDQSRADEILASFCADFQAAIDKQANGK